MIPETMTQPAAPDALRPPQIPVGATSQWQCFFCGRDIFTSFVQFPVVSGARKNGHGKGREFYARAHDSCYDKQISGGR